MELPSGVAIDSRSRRVETFIRDDATIGGHPASEPMTRGRTSVIKPSRPPTLYSKPSGGARSSPTRPRRLLLNPKFFRNGIVMLVLVVGTAALLFTWIQSNGSPSATHTYSQFLTDVKDGRVILLPDECRIFLKYL